MSRFIKKHEAILWLLACVAVAIPLFMFARPVPYCGTPNETTRTACITESNGNTYIVMNGVRHLL